MRPTIKISQEDYQRLIQRLFNTEDGKTLLNVWEDLFLYKKIANYGDIPLDIGIKQGEAGFVLSIVNLLEQIKKGGQ